MASRDTPPQPDDSQVARAGPRNFRKIVAAFTLTGIGDRIASAKTTLPWLLGVAGAPAWSVGLLVPLRESGSMLPQIALGAWVKRQPQRKHVWVAGSLVQATALLGIAWAGVALTGVAAGLAVLGLLAVFSVGRAASSLASKDVIGRAIARDRRGRLNGWKSAFAGVGALAAGAALGLFGGSESVWIYAVLLGCGAALWFIAAAIFSRVAEFPEAGDGNAASLRESLGKWRLLRDDAPFRRFVIARALAMGSGLAAPYYLILARGDLGSGAAALGVFIIAEGLAGALSSPLWGRWADHSSRAVFATACALAALLTLGVAAWSWLSDGSGARWFYPPVFFALGLAHAGVRIGRKTHLVNMASGDLRTDYVAVSNSAMGVLLLVTGGVGALASLVSIQAALVILALAGLAGAWLGATRWSR